MRSNGENKTVLSWNIRLPITHELMDKRRVMGLSENKMENV